jgi:hypothetical protein
LQNAHSGRPITRLAEGSARPGRAIDGRPRRERVRHIGPSVQRSALGMPLST